MALTEDQMQDIKEAWDIVDTDGDSKIQSNLLGVVMRSLGRTPTDQELQSMIAQLDPTGGQGQIDYQQFVGLMSRTSHEKLNADELIESFRVFDKELNGTIPTSELRTIMLTQGECLNDDEADEMVLEADPDGTGRVDYATFAQMMLQHAQ